MLRILTAKQLTEWEVFLSIDPEREWRQDFRLAYIASHITNLVIRSLGAKGAALTQVKDFLIDWAKEETLGEQTPEQMKEILLSIARSANRRYEKEKLTTPQNVLEPKSKKRKEDIPPNFR